MYYKLIPSPQENIITINRDLARKKGLKENDEITLKAGLRESKALICISSAINKSSIIMGQYLLEDLCLPTSIFYQLRSFNTHLELGPTIGLLLMKEMKNIDQKALEHFLKYVILYPHFHGLIYVFAQDSINISENTALGYYFNPRNKSSQPIWQRALLPLPSSIYRRTPLPYSLLKDLIFKTNNKLFNSDYFDKLYFWKFFSETKLKSCLPETKELLSLEDLDLMLHNHKVVYLKPANGSLGKGLLSVSRETELYYLRKKNNSAFQDMNKSELTQFIKNLLKSRTYLVQEAIEVLRMDRRLTSFRVIMQKDDTPGWNCTCIIACIGCPDGISSHFQTSGFTFSMEDFLINHLKYDEKLVYQKKEEVIDLCLQACMYLDDSGENYGDLGIDLVIDNKLKPWLVEINKRHDHRMPLSIKDEQSYLSVKSNPIKYALKLTGFS